MQSIKKDKLNIKLINAKSTNMIKIRITGDCEEQKSNEYKSYKIVQYFLQNQIRMLKRTYCVLRKIWKTDKHAHRASPSLNH